MLVQTPSYSLLVHILAAVICAVLMDYKRPMLSLSAGLVLFVLYGDSGRIAGLMLTFFASFVSGLFSAIRED